MTTTRRHGVGKAGVERILEAQNGGCAICGEPYADEPGKRLAMDHDHKHCPGPKGCAECVRGMLCLHCNNILRSAKDDPARLRRAAAYLDGDTPWAWVSGAKLGEGEG